MRPRWLPYRLETAIIAVATALMIGAFPFVYTLAEAAR